jgi:hypothetical protein
MGIRGRRAGAFRQIVIARLTGDPALTDLEYWIARVEPGNDSEGRREMLHAA